MLIAERALLQAFWFFCYFLCVFLSWIFIALVFTRCDSAIFTLWALLFRFKFSNSFDFFIGLHFSNNKNYVVCSLLGRICEGARTGTGVASFTAMKRRLKAAVNVAERVTKVTAKKVRIVPSMLAREIQVKILVEVSQDFNNVIFATVKWNWKWTHQSHHRQRSSTSYCI